jgi:ubiquinone/menaquinone biosynthesis C-methylase UbiE
MADFDRVSKIYDATRKAPDDVMSATLAIMEKVLTGYDRILDVGIGTGRFAKPLVDRGFPIVGVDISTSMMGKAKERGVGDLVRGDIPHLPFLDRSFGAAIFVLVLHLVQDWVAVLNEIGRVTQGVIVSTVGRGEGLNIRELYLRLREAYGVPLRRFNEDTEGLRSALRPVEVYPVMDRIVESKTDESIAYFAERKSSITWDVPQAIHDKIIKTIRSGHGGRVLRQRMVDEVAVWKAEQFRSFKSSPQL